MAGITQFRQLTAWQEAHKLVLEVYRISKAYPSDERYGLVSQMRRAAVSIPANIAEGFKRRGIQEKNSLLQHRRRLSGGGQVLSDPIQGLELHIFR